ncbi:DUF2071 domain-containing protein [Candidatus Frankia alpina]|uniref:DUF2071 domain-containing protein n=1 Tax=Candidatus Frankia alpina TaxID=2699483 RepID=UPI0022A712A5|nr:DUF2071 domain-containing protein [Candidatus Frankia alpina]
MPAAGPAAGGGREPAAGARRRAADRRRTRPPRALPDRPLAHVQLRPRPPPGAEVWHQPWPLHRADLLDVDDHLLTAAGLPQPTGAPLVHYSPGVNVRIGPQRPCSGGLRS